MVAWGCVQTQLSIVWCGLDFKPEFLSIDIVDTMKMACCVSRLVTARVIISLILSPSSEEFSFSRAS